MRTWLLLLLVLVLPVLAGCAGEGASCQPEPVGDLPVGLVASVPVLLARINGMPALLVLDTGSDATVLTRAAAARLGVSEQGKVRAFLGAGGPAPFGEAVLDRASLGPVALDGRRVLLTEGLAPPLDGVVGIDTLVGFELDLDVPHGRLSLYRARPCATARPPDASVEWVALPVAQRPLSGHLMAPALLDGQPLAGLLDTGASRSVLSLQAAGEQGYDARRLARLPGARGTAMNRAGIALRTARFHTLQVGPVVLSEPVLGVADLPAQAGDMLIGADVLATRRLWLSFLTGRAFVGR